MACIKCNENNNEYHFKVLEVQTLHVRDIGREKKVQALGGFKEFSVCETCAKEKLFHYTEDKKHFLLAVLPYTVLSVLGMILSNCFWRGNGAIRLFSLAMTICGILGLYSTATGIYKKRKELLHHTKEEALEMCAWECMLDGAPKKYDINDITYIPINKTTLARKNGDLMILYDLLPEIAVLAWDKMHG